MRKVLLALAFLFLANSAFARGYYGEYVRRGGVASISSLSGTPLKVMASYPGASVRVYACNTSTPVTIYSTFAGGALSQPITANSNAFFEFWTDAPCVKLEFTGGGLPSTIIRDNTVIPTAGSGGTISGAVCDGVTDDTAAFQAAENIAGGHEILIPAGVCKITDTILINQDRVNFRGQGPQASVVDFVPTTNDKAAFLAQKSPAIGQVSFRNFAIRSSDTTYRKFGIQLVVCSECVVEDVAIGINFRGGAAIPPFTGGGSSSSLYIQGHDFIRVSRAEFGADIPIRIGDCPLDVLDFDHSVIEYTYTLASTGNPNVYVETGLHITNSGFSNFAWVGGAYGLYWVDTSSIGNSSQFFLEHGRYEQGTSASGWGVIIEHNQALRLFSMTDVGLGSATRGFKLRRVEADLRNVEYLSTSLTAMDVDGTVNPLTLWNVFFQGGSTVTVSGLTKVWALQRAGTLSPTWRFEQYIQTADPNFSNGRCAEFMGVLRCSYKGTALANGANIQIPSLGGAINLGRITTCFDGATRDGCFSTWVSDSSTPIEVFTSNTAWTGVGSTGGKITVDGLGATVLLRNNLGESVDYFVEVSMLSQ